MNTSRERGFTLLELLIVMGILSAFLTMLVQLVDTGLRLFGEGELGQELADRVPYNVVVVELEEGPFFHSNVVGCPNQAVHIGMPVEVVFDDVSEDVTLPRFRPRGGAA